MVELLNKIKRVQALAEIGLEFCEIDYDKERYEELNQIAFEMMAMVADKPASQLKVTVMEHNGYRTPKVDVRGVVLNDKGEVLLIRENVDGKWALPGGWADVAYSPKEVAVKEVWEEAGITTEAQRLVAVYFNERHNPPDLWSIYKMFIHCKWISGEPSTGSETSAVQFFPLHSLPPLSEVRVTEKQIQEVVRLIQTDNLNVYID